MKIAYFDCSSGIAGNMVLAALIEAGVAPSYLKKELKKLGIPHYALRVTKTKRGLISGTYVDVKFGQEKHRRNLKDIIVIIKNSKLSKDVKQLSSRIFKRLANAEAKVHRIPINKVHFHEVGAVDAIIDIVGTAICLEKLGIEKAYCSPIPYGKGKIKHAHGILPIPAPATAELLKGIPTYQENVKGELVTPTGAAIITTIANDFIDTPRIRLEAIGNGAGSKIYPKLPNTLRVFIGETLIPTQKDTILQIESNIDDMDPKNLNKMIKKLVKAGALDAYISPIQMKKNRPAACLVALCIPEEREKILENIFSLTTTLGCRIFMVPREKLKKKFSKVKTKYGKAKIKIGLLGSAVKTIAPEYEDYKRIAKKHSIPIHKVYKEVKYTAWTKIYPGK